MAKLARNCPVCAKTLTLSESIILGDKKLNTYTCGHFFTEDIGDNSIRPIFTSVIGDKKARPYQEEGVQFWLDCNFNGICADQMRLGKTPQVLLALQSALTADKQSHSPILFIVRSANIMQWIREQKIWCDSLPNGIWMIQGTKAFIPPGFTSYIVSMDTFSRLDTQTLLNFGFKHVVIDEAHGFKNPSSKRSQQLIAFLSEISKATITYTVNFNCIVCNNQWPEEVTKVTTKDSETVSHSSYCPACSAYNRVTGQREKIDIKRKCSVAFLTGTPIKNRADEYFVPLNILMPDYFSSLTSFKNNWLQQDASGRYTRVKEWRLNDFKELLKPIMIRREKEDVYTDLPLMNRTFSIVTIEDENLKKAYNAVLDRLEAQLDSLTYFNSIAELTLLRQICGLAKVNTAVEYVEELLDNSETGKVAIGIHHTAIKGALESRLAKYGVVTLTGSDNAYQKDRIMRTFETDSNRVLVINMLAGGIGMDFHYINNVMVLERQWNSADEEQFEFRFYNPDKSIKTASTNIEYPMAKGTIDEYYYDRVEETRKMFGETIGTNWSLSADPQSFKELLHQTVGSRL